MLAALVIIVALASPLAAALEAERVPSPPAVRYADGRLSVQLERVPLDVVLAAVERETGLVIQGEAQDWREVTKRFEDVPIARALHRLLGRQNFVLRYDGEGNPVRLVLLGRHGLAPQKSRPQKHVRPLATVVAREPAVHVGPTLARLFGTSSVRLVRVVSTAFRNPVADVRAEARRTLIAALQQRPTLREALRNSPTAQIAAFLRPWPTAHVREFLHEMKVGTRDPVLRRIAQQTEGVLQRAPVHAAARPVR